MQTDNLAAQVKGTRVLNAVAAGQTDQNSAAVDMKGFESVLFMAAFGAITATAVTKIKAQQSSDNVTFNDLAGTEVVVADSADNKVFWLDVVKPEDRYVRLVVDRGTADAVIDGVFALQYGAKKVPTTHDATFGGGELHVSPDEGTP